MQTGACLFFSLHSVDSHQNLCTDHLLQSLSQHCVLVYSRGSLRSKHMYTVVVASLFFMSLALPNVQTAVLIHYLLQFEGCSCV